MPIRPGSKPSSKSAFDDWLNFHVARCHRTNWSAQLTHVRHPDRIKQMSGKNWVNFNHHLTQNCCLISLSFDLITPSVNITQLECCNQNAHCAVESAKCQLYSGETVTGSAIPLLFCHSVWSDTLQSCSHRSFIYFSTTRGHSQKGCFYFLSISTYST